MRDAPATVEQVVTLAAVLVPERAAAIVVLVTAPLGEIASRRAAQLSALPRHERITALSAALQGTSGAGTARHPSAREALLDRLRWHGR